MTVQIQKNDVFRCAIKDTQCMGCVVKLVEALHRYSVHVAILCKIPDSGTCMLARRTTISPFPKLVLMNDFTALAHSRSLVASIGRSIVCESDVTVSLPNFACISNFILHVHMCTETEKYDDDDALTDDFNLDSTLKSPLHIQTCR